MLETWHFFKSSENVINCSKRFINPIKINKNEIEIEMRTA